MKYFVIYLAIGIIVLVVMLGLHFQKNRRRPGYEPSNLLEQIHGKPSLAKRVLENVVVPVLAGILVIGAWPVAVIMAAKLMRKENAAEKTSAPTEPQITESDLRDKLSIAEVEQRERVSDPLGAVPDLPFGHLHSAWGAYRDELSPDDEIWSFAKTWNDGWQGPQMITGYVAVQNGQTGKHFITRQRTLEENTG